MKIVVIGGVAGGATAIARLRRLDENAEIILLERGSYVSFANCGLPYYVGNTIENRDALFVTTDEDIIKKYNVDVRINSEAMKIFPKDKKILVKNHETSKEYELSYDKLLISTGSHPFVPNAEGIDSKNVFTLVNIPDVDKITSYVKENNPKKAVVIGAGFIGLETAENLVDLGIETTVVEMADHVMPPLDSDMARLVENHMIGKGVNLMLGEGFESILNDGKTVHLKSKKDIDTDLIILSIGVRPNSKLAKDAGIKTTDRGHIKVNDFMKTSDENIYAIGDVIGVKDYITKKDTAVPLAGPANKQGREVALNMLGLGSSKYDGTMGTSVAKIFDMTVASTGLNEKTLNKNGKVYRKDYFVSVIHPMSHAGYYPGATPMTLKLIYGLDGKVLGAQIVGYGGVDKRIDTIATTIHFNGDVDDLSRLELAYAPPYSSAKDPVNFAGYTARNFLDGLTEPVLYREYEENKDKFTLLDVREDAEVVSGMLEGAVHIPLTELRNRLDELDKDKRYLAYCAGAMLVDAVAALFFGYMFDKKGTRALVISTIISAPFSLFIFGFNSVNAVLFGIVLWGVGMGAQESILKAAVTSVVPKQSRATGYGIFECFFGIFWFLGSWLLGVLYDISIPLMIGISIIAQILAIPFYFKSSKEA